MEPPVTWSFPESLFPNHVTSLRLAFFGHDLPKPTHLMGTLPDMSTLTKKMTKADRAKFRARLETRHIIGLKLRIKLIMVSSKLLDCSSSPQDKRQAKRKIPRKYYIKEKKEGDQKKTTVQGCKDLAFSAHYPRGFASAIFKLWITAFQDL